jgi:carbon storage regulator
VEVQGDKVRLGFQSPKEITIHRQEVYEAIKRSEGSEEAPAEDTESGT